MTLLILFNHWSLAIYVLHLAYQTVYVQHQSSNSQFVCARNGSYWIQFLLYSTRMLIWCHEQDDFSHYTRESIFTTMWSKTALPFTDSDVFLSSSRINFQITIKQCMSGTNSINSLPWLLLAISKKNCSQIVSISLT